MPKFHVERKKTINAPVEKVYGVLSDMGQWEAWSPWLIMDPDTSVSVREDKKHYGWEGNRVGSGNMTIKKAVENESVDYDLQFLKPWKSQADVFMKIRPVESGTEVTWSMDSSLPFFMFFMKKSMTAYISSDYDRGLNLLKDYVEDGHVHSKLVHHGVETFPGCDYIGVKRSCSMAEAPAMMEKDFTALMVEAHKDNNMHPHHAFCIYHKWDMVKQQVSYTAGVPYEGEKPSLPFTNAEGSIPETKNYVIEHIGPYEHLGNAWSTLATMQRNKEFKINKGIHPFETYGNSPKNTDPKDLSVKIHFAVK